MPQQVLLLGYKTLQLFQQYHVHNMQTDFTMVFPSKVNLEFATVC